MNELATEFKFKQIEDCDQQMVRGLSSMEVMKHLGVPMWKLPKIMNRMRSRAAEDWQAIQLFDGVESMLQGLAASGRSLGMVSSNSEANVRKILGPSNAALIQHFACGASLFGKASKLQTVLRRSGFRAEETLYIGDEIRDARATRKAKMAFGAVGWGYTQIEALKKEAPAMVFDRVEQITARLNEVADLSRRTAG